MTRASCYKGPGAAKSARVLQALGLVALAAMGCAQPQPARQEQAALIISDQAPGLTRASEKREADVVLRGGEVLIPLEGAAKQLNWRAPLGGAVTTRSGTVAPYARTGGEFALFVFDSDLRSGVPVVARDWLCSRMGDPAPNQRPCVQSLRRLAFGNATTIGYVPCVDLGCPIIAVQPSGRLQHAKVDGLMEARAMTISGRNVVVAFSHWVRDAGYTGRRALVFDANPVLRVLADISVEQIDSRESVVVSRVGELHAAPTGLVYEGREQRIVKETGHVLGSTPVRIEYNLSPDGRVFERSE